jgi:hypothetical protein
VDESEKLIAMVALGDTEQATKAWAVWNAKNSKQEASAILSWAGGYMYHNLKKAGYQDKYLHGIYWYNQISNNLKFKLAKPILNELNKNFTIIPIKSFGMSFRDFSWGFRPVADFDFYVDSMYLEEYWRYMDSKNILPLLGVSEKEFEFKIQNQRGSWNFIKEKAFDIDVHWRLFDHLTLNKNRELAAVEVEKIENSAEIKNFLSINLEIVLLANHFYFQGDKRFNGLFDFYSTSKKVDPKKVIDILKITETSDSFIFTIDAVSEILGKNINSNLIMIRKYFQSTPLKKIDSINCKSRYFSRINLDDFEPKLHRHGYIYKFWNFFGRHSFLEKIILKLFGPFNLQMMPENKKIDMTSVENLSIGWHHLYQNNLFRWSHSPDTRISFFSRKNRTYRVEIITDKNEFKSSPVGAFNLFINGEFQGTCTNENNLHECIYKTNLDFIEISIRSNLLFDYRRSNNFNWYRMSVPIKSIKVENIEIS